MLLTKSHFYFKYIFKLSQCDSDSIEFKRYQKIRSRVSSSTLMKIEKSIEETKRNNSIAHFQKESNLLLLHRNFRKVGKLWQKVKQQ